MNSAAADTLDERYQAPEDVASLKRIIAQQEREIRLLHEKVHYLLHHRFGRSSERLNTDQGVSFKPPADAILEAEEEDTVTIKGETKQEEKQEKGDYYRSAISRGAFTRTVILPAVVDADETKAQFKDDILQLTMPKVEKAKRRSIEID